MLKTKNVIWRFFASVKLALATLIILATASILGTLIKQGQTPEYYLQEYGADLARIFEILHIGKMYGSWWFLSLLALFAINLIVCSIERLPITLRLMREDNLDIGPLKLENMQPACKLKSKLSAAAAGDRISKHLARTGWKKLRRRDDGDGSILLFAQRGTWTRLGVFIVHMSILVIAAGALLGSFYGFKAYVFLPEGRTTRNVFLQGSGEPVPLDFELRGDDFEPLALTRNEGLRAERSTLTVLDFEGREMARKTVFVNEPLTYRGISFYKADAHPLEEYFVVIRSQAMADEQAFRVPSDRDVNWPGTTIFFRVDELQQDADGVVQRARILLTTGPDSPPEEVWVDNRSKTTIGRPGNEFTVGFRQLYTTLLLSTKDPGTWVVCLGSIQMMLGLFVSFCLAHRRIWVRITAGAKQGSTIHICGVSSKNRPAFEQRFQKLADDLGKDVGS